MNHNTITKKENQIKPAKYEALSVAKLLFLQDSDRKYFTDEKKKNDITPVITTLESGIIVYKVHTHFWLLYKEINIDKIEDIKDAETKEFIIEHFNYLKTIPDQTL
ncbi:690_t:CDS:2 [Scutellospora calospora]|uniref:690_t:CDS:1 n=1 Tax=Scutellospora calospora TaxID=85575 RepID=A0ACA9LHY7_9GLOM|nr:690_t:CDS:2 [Scutellospora calospora]